MTRSLHLARMAWRRIELGQEPVESIAKAIAQASENASAYPVGAENLPRLQRQVIVALSAGVTMSPVELTAQLNRTWGSIRRSLEALVSAQLVRHLGRGRYRIHSSPAKFISRYTYRYANSERGRKIA